MGQSELATLGTLRIRDPQLRELFMEFMEATKRGGTYDDLLYRFFREMKDASWYEMISHPDAPRWAYLFARQVRKGRTVELEDVVAMDGQASLDYIMEVVGRYGLSCGRTVYADSKVRYKSILDESLPKGIFYLGHPYPLRDGGIWLMIDQDHPNLVKVAEITPIGAGGNAGVVLGEVDLLRSGAPRSEVHRIAEAVKEGVASPNQKKLLAKYAKIAWGRNDGASRLYEMQVGEDQVEEIASTISKFFGVERDR